MTFQFDENDYDKLMKILSKSGYYIKIYKASENGNASAPIKQMSTPTVDTEIERELYKKGLTENGYYVVFAFDKSDGKKVVKSQMFLNPASAKPETKDTQNLAGESPKPLGNDAIQMYELGSNSAMALVEKLQAMNDSTLQKFVDLTKEQQKHTQEEQKIQQAERQELLQKLEKLYKKKEKEEAENGGTDLISLAGQFLPVLMNMGKAPQSQSQTQSQIPNLFAGIGNEQANTSSTSPASQTPPQPPKVKI